MPLSCPHHPTRSRGEHYTWRLEEIRIVARPQIDVIPRLRNVRNALGIRPPFGHSCLARALCLRLSVSLEHFPTQI